MRATILIATRNRLEQLRCGIAALREREYEDVEILVVDDGSADGTVEFLETQSDLLRFITTGREGRHVLDPSRVWNLGHRHAQSDVVIEQGGEVCHLNDCVTPLVAMCTPGTIALARVHDGTPEEMGQVVADISLGLYQHPGDVALTKVMTDMTHVRVPLVGLHKTRLYVGVERPAPLLFCGAIHRADFDAVGGYDETPHPPEYGNNDGDMARRQMERGVRFAFLGSAVAFHLRHPKR